jgi:hypothetical protein
MKEEETKKARTVGETEQNKQDRHISRKAA